MAKILIVDDRPTNREYLRTLLGYGGHQLFEACDGSVALDLVRAQRPDLVITDILMPTVDGYEFLRRLREDPAIAATPVIFLTAHYQEREARALGEAAGVFRVLTKPVEPETVLETVAAALRADPPATGTIDPSFDPEHLRLITDKLYEKANELRTANGKLQALIDLGLRLGSERDPQFLLQGACHAAREILGARAAAVGVLDGEGTRLRQFAGSGLETETIAGLARLDARAGCFRTVLTECCSVRLNSTAAASRDPGLSAILTTYDGALVTPIISPNRVYGWLCLFDRVDGESFSSEDERIAGILAAQLGRIYENGSLYADLLRHASELEREIGQRRLAETEARRSSAL